MKISSPEPSILVIDDNTDDLLNVALAAKQRFIVICAEAQSIEEARKLIETRHFDIIFFGHKCLEEGIQLYIEILNNGRMGCQFLLFVANPSELSSDFSRHFKMVFKPDVSSLVGAAEWPPR